MGVGEVLESARLKFATEEGELDVDEDEYGNFMIGGQELSFEAWGALNKTSEPEIVRANVVIPPQKRRRYGSLAKFGKCQKFLGLDRRQLKFLNRLVWTTRPMERQWRRPIDRLRRRRMSRLGHYKGKS